MKKFTILSLVFVMALALSVAPVFAHPVWYNNSDVTVKNVNAYTGVFNNVEVSANTGDNGAFGRGRVFTGNAYADSLVSNTVNTNTTAVRASRCGRCLDDVRVVNRNMFTLVGNDVYVDANTGDNVAASHGYRRHFNRSLVSTGNARAISTVVNVVNTNVTRVR